MSITQSIGNYCIYAAYKRFKRDTLMDVGVSTTPFLITKSNGYGYCQILRDIEFSFTLKNSERAKVYFLKVRCNPNIQKQRKNIIKYLYDNKKTYEKLFVIDVCLQQINKNINRNTILKQKEVLNKSIIYEILSSKLPSEIIDKITSYINTTISASIVYHKMKIPLKTCDGLSERYYFSNPSLYIPDYTINMIKKS